MAAAKTTRRFYQNNHVCTELDGSVTRSIFRHQDSLLALCTSGAEESRSIMAVDNSNTVMSELRDSGKAQFAYTPYGHRTVQGESNNPLAFNGEILDTPTDCYLLGSYRLASPGSYRFYSDDDQSPFGKGGLNSKAYCAGDPVNNVDPTGHFPLSIFLNTAIGITGAATVGTAIAGALVKDPKSRHILYITAGVLGFATLTLMTGAYVKSQLKSSNLQKENRSLNGKIYALRQTVQDQHRTIIHQNGTIYDLRNTINPPQGAASSNSVSHAPAVPTQPQPSSGVDLSVRYDANIGKVVTRISTPHTQHNAGSPPSSYSEADPSQNISRFRQQTFGL